MQVRVMTRCAGLLAVLLLSFQLVAGLNRQKAVFDAVWRTANATWYPTLSGNDGACLYGNANNTAYGYYTAAGSSAIFNCGACYQVVCIRNQLCSSTPVNITITNLCPQSGKEGVCSGNKVHFDMLEFAYKKLAKPGKELDLVKRTSISINYKRVPCRYPKRNIKLSIRGNPRYLGILVKDVQGAGTITDVYLQTANSRKWRKMVYSFGAMYAITTGPTFTGPYAVKVSNNRTGESVVCPKKLPNTLTFGADYDCGAQFPA